MSRVTSPPPRKDPQVRTVRPAPPPGLRSRKAFSYSAGAAEGRFLLQKCAVCETWCYPAREACPKCLSIDLPWREAPAGGSLIAETVIRASTNTYFRERLPWRMGTVQLDCGPVLIAHVHNDVGMEAKSGGRVRVIARTDRSGQGVVIALPEQDSDTMADDRNFREFTCDPKFRRVLITDGRSAVGQSLARALSAAGAAMIHVGIAEEWRPVAGRSELEAIPNVVLVPLDVSDTVSVNELAGEIGGKVDILINTADHVRPGGALDRKDITTARDEMETNYFGSMRLMQAFAPGMSARGADGDNSACAWVNILSVHALSNSGPFSASQASHAAALSLSQSLRVDMAGSGVKVVQALVGPIDDEWRQLVPPPKVSPKQIASAIVGGLQQGLEDLVIGPVAEDVFARWKQDPSALGRELMQGSE